MTQTPVRIGTAPAEPAPIESFQFYLGAEGADDTIYTAVKPKTTVMLDLAEALMDDANMLGQMQALRGLMQKVLDPESYAALRARMEDPEDALDIDHPDIMEMFQAIVGRWYGRPIGRRAGSSGRPATTGPRSTVRRRSKVRT